MTPDLAWAAGMAAVDMVASRVRKHNIACDLQFGYLHAALHHRHMNELLAMQMNGHTAVMPI